MLKKNKITDLQTISDIKFSHLDKIIFPKSNISKKDIILYYQKIAPFFIPHATNHLMVMQRFPDGIHHEGFYQKQISDYFPSWISHKTIPLKQGQSQTLLIVDKPQTLVYLANQLVIEFHSWLSSSNSITHPDKIVFDLDPTNNNIKDLQFIALKLKTIVESHHLIPFIMTTGSRGYHVTVPIIAQHSFDTVHEFAKSIAYTLATQYPKYCTTELNKTKRDGKIFIDYLRNSYGQTSIACYSLRAHEHAPIATPINWHELKKTTPQKYTLKNIFKRLSRTKDPWQNFKDSAKKLLLP